MSRCKRSQQRSTNAIELLLCFLQAAMQSLSDSRGVLVVASEHDASHLLVSRLRPLMRHSGTVDMWTVVTPDDIVLANRTIASNGRLVWIGTAPKAHEGLGGLPRRTSRSRGGMARPGAYEAVWVWCGKLAADGENTQADDARAPRCKNLRRSTTGLEVQVGFQSGRMVVRTTQAPEWKNASGALRCSGTLRLNLS